MYVECPLVKINYTFVLAPSKCFVTGWDGGGGGGEYHTKTKGPKFVA